MRINKFLSESGLTSRRGADALIQEGRVKLNGKILTAVGTEIDIDNDTVTVDGKRVKPVSRYSYLMFNKPKGCVTTADDSKDKGRTEDKKTKSDSTVKPESRRRTVYDYLTDINKRLLPVGRLDYESEGLLLFTNDGDLIYKLTHPSNEIPKTYIVTVEGHPDKDVIEKLKGGVALDDGDVTGGAVVTVKGEDDKFTKLEITIREGKNREIRRMLAAVGYTVTFLKRKAIGDLKLGGLARGGYRYLTEKEIKYLKDM